MIFKLESKFLLAFLNKVWFTAKFYGTAIIFKGIAKD